MKTFALLSLLTLCCCRIAFADDPPEVDWNVSNPKVKATIKEFEATTKKLNEQYKAHHKKDLDALRDALTKIMKEQAQATDIDGAAKTKALVSALAAGAEPPVADAPERTPPAKAVYLDELTETSSAVGHGVIGKQGLMGYNDKRASVRGKATEHAVSTHATTNGKSHATYAIDGKYKTLKGAAAINDSSHGNTPLTFRVIGDGKELWKSAPMSQAGAAQMFNVKMTGVKVLRIEVECLGSSFGMHSLWFEPQLK